MSFKSGITAARLRISDTEAGLDGIRERYVATGGDTAFAASVFWATCGFVSGGMVCGRWTGSCGERLGREIVGNSPGDNRSVTPGACMCLDCLTRKGCASSCSEISFSRLVGTSSG